MFICAYACIEMYVYINHCSASYHMYFIAFSASLL